MAKTTPSMAKGHINRSLLQIIDKPPTKVQKQQIWKYFENKCAYCGIYIEPDSRKGHLDHLISTKDGGSNDIYNFVLACNICNGDEKRESQWQTFLQNKCSDLPSEIYLKRLLHIENWHNQSEVDQLDTEILNKIQAIIEKAKNDFDCSVEQMRILRDSIIKNNP